MTVSIKTNQEMMDDLAAKDPTLAWLIRRFGPMEIPLHDDYFTSLASAIVGQQLSNKVADVLWDRLCHLAEGNVTPSILLDLNDEKIRAIGISYAKINYLKSLAQAVLDGSLPFGDFHLQTDGEVMKALCDVKGIGPWTAEMFLIFSLGRLDVYSMGDAGLKRAIMWLYNLEQLPDNKHLKEITDKWAPYRTIASLYLWKVLDGDWMGSGKDELAKEV